MLDGAILVWFILTGASLAFVVWDSFTNGVTSWVQASRLDPGHGLYRTRRSLLLPPGLPPPVPRWTRPLYPRHLEAEAQL